MRAVSGEVLQGTSWIAEELERLRAEGQYRALHVAVPDTDLRWIWRDGQRLLNMASNHYLGLSHALDAAMLNRWQAYESELFQAHIGELPDELPKPQPERGVATGATASRLIVGGGPALAQFEREFAAYKQTEACVVFGSGYMANAGIVSALVGRRDLVFSDRLNHASIVDGAVLSRAEVVRYRNRDMDQLERLLHAAEPGRRKLIVTDAVFSMDGSLAPLERLVELKRRYGAMLMIDEAHSGGVFGSEGRGLAHALGVSGEIDVLMGTFSKAYGCYGAYAAGSSIVIDYLINKARTLLFSTALPPMVAHAIRDQWQTVRQDEWRRQKLLSHAERFRKELQALGFDTGDSECHIVPIIVGGNERALEFGRRLREEGIAAVPIRPPTVPQGTARIRLTPMATHRESELDWALERIAAVGREMGVIRS